MDNLEQRQGPDGSDGKESAGNAGDLVQSWGWKDPLKEGMATHSSVPAWRIPGMEKPGGLPSMGSHRVEATQQQQQHENLT